MPNTRRLLPILILIVAGESVFLLPFVLPRVFRHAVLEGFGLTNLELGSAFSVYGLVALSAYFFGGPLADRFSGRRLISSSLVFTGLGGFYFLLKPTYTGVVLLYGYWGFTTIFLLWAAMLRATRLWGGEGFQGRAFGNLEGGRGLIAAVLAVLGILVFAEYTGVDAEGGVAIRQVYLSTSVYVVLVGIAVFALMPEAVSEKDQSRHWINPSEFLETIKDPRVWANGLIIVCAYVGYRVTDDFSLYANEVLGFDDVKAAIVGAVAIMFRPLFAFMAGMVADRYGALRATRWSFVIMIAGSTPIIFFGSAGFAPVWILSTMAFTLLGIYGLRGIYFALMDEIELPYGSTGTAVGIISLLGYTPDIFFSPLMGYLLDRFPGATGHSAVFGVLTLFSLIGLAMALWISRRLAKSSRMNRL